MPQLALRPLKYQDNASLLNAIRKTASTDYQSRIPDATKASMQETLAALTSTRGTWNEFVEALINRIGLVLVKNQIWSNPLAKFKRGMLEYGDTIEEINVGLIKAHTFNPDRLYLEKDVFGNYPPDVQASYHKLNRQNFYPISINEDLLRRAFLDENGLASFVGSVMQAPATSDQWDEFLLTCQLFREYDDNQGFFNVKVADLQSSNTVSDSQYFLRQVRELSGKLQFISTYYNASGMPVSVNPEDLELFITPEALAAIDVEALAAAFNIDKANMPAKINLMPQENFNIDGAQAVLTTRDFFVIADNRIETTSMWNPVSLNNNFFLHHWEVISASRFTPAILFTATRESTVINIDNNPVTGITSLSVADPVTGDTVADVTRGKLYQVLATVNTTPAGGDNDAAKLVVIAHVGNALFAPLSPRTHVTDEGVLHVGYDEPNAEIDIQVISVDNNEVTATTSVTVVGDLLSLWPPYVETDNDNDGVLEPDYPETLELVDGSLLIPHIVGNTWTKQVNTGVAFTVSGNKVTIPSHGLEVGDIVNFGAITSTTNFTAGTTYYVISVVDVNTVTLSATSGGAVVVVNAAGTAASATVTAHDESTLTVPATTTVELIGTPETGYELPSGVTGIYTLAN